MLPLSCEAKTQPLLTPACHRSKPGISGIALLYTSWACYCAAGKNLVTHGGHGLLECHKGHQRAGRGLRRGTGNTMSQQSKTTETQNKQKQLHAKKPFSNAHQCQWLTVLLSTQLQSIPSIKDWCKGELF